MSNRLIVSGLALFTHCGVTAEERAVGQRVLVDLDLLVDLGDAARRGELTATVDYAELCRQIQEVGSAVRHTLLEALAIDLADAVLARPRVREVCVRITKPHPPIAPDVGAFSVELTRRHSEAAGRERASTPRD
jgi:dihydroneopterin aldolase